MVRKLLGVSAARAPGSMFFAQPPESAPLLLAYGDPRSLSLKAWPKDTSPVTHPSPQGTSYSTGLLSGILLLFWFLRPYSTTIKPNRHILYPQGLLSSLVKALSPNRLGLVACNTWACRSRAAVKSRGIGFLVGASLPSGANWHVDSVQAAK